MKPYLRKLATGLVTAGLTSLVFAQAITGSTSSTVPMDGAPKTGLPPTEAGKPVPGTIAKLGWMSGCWESGW